MSDAEAPVLAEARNRVGHLTLNRPAGLNALTLPMIRILWQQLQAWEDDPTILAVVLRANGEKAFCAGGDIRALYDSYRAGDDLHHIFFEEEYALDQYIHDYPKPIVALMDGFVLGGGMGLVQGAALRVVTERVKMGMPETGIGYFPDVGGSYFLPRLPGELGFYLGITGIQVRATDALYARLADWCLPSEQLAEFERCLDHMTWTGHPHESLSSLLATLASNRLTGAELKALRPAIDEHFALPDLPAIRASLQAESRPEYQDWAEQTVKLLDSRSPLAMSVTLELLRRGRTLSLANCFELELHLDRQWFAKGDLMEGVRALIVDKDKSPRWNPPTLEQLENKRVSEFFNGFQPTKAQRSA
ncbi:enoyl-CoA hydratase/isomerase family protein [Pseudomonas sp. GD03721]|nr:MULTISPECIES: enoyl-CoA hydratase/isomerase family protein [unclassified Pseudomonas]MDH1440410.1 enoyl-CoA hydratase/isomerase family protein [Pseudomonas sp. GD03722]WGG03502.1 enoyl-CoA hydratase/isomerase family protein [Pseudomonas sp. GD03721]WGG07670.1 enoyl-CoA hydratase/isomerase family protein [Pseudomonas sp. GD03919]